MQSNLKSKEKCIFVFLVSRSTTLLHYEGTRESPKTNVLHLSKPFSSASQSHSFQNQPTEVFTSPDLQEMVHSLPSPLPWFSLLSVEASALLEQPPATKR